MHGKRNIVLLGFIAGLATLLSACAGGGASPNASDLAEGKNFDLSRYDRVMVDPVVVEFDESWEPSHTGSRLPMSESERERVAEEVAELFDPAFRQELELGGHVNVVEQAGSGVLRITPKLVDVYLNAPAPLARPGATYTRSVGHVTVHLVFRDAVTGEQVLELHDRVRGRDIGLLRTASPVYNTIELTRIFEDWAQVIRQDLFRAP